MSKPNQVEFATRKGQPVIIRHKPAARVNHWVVAICFILAAVSGLALFHPNMYWMASIFGSGTWARILHPFIGVLMFVSFMGLVLRYWHHNLINKQDIQWLKQINDVITGNEHKLPPTGIYNAGQKVLFWSLLCLMLGLLATGVVIWKSYFSHYFPHNLIELSVLLHAFLAFALISMIIVHVLAAFLASGSIAAMINGTVTYGWAKHNHPLWYKEIVDAEKALAKKK